MQNLEQRLHAYEPLWGEWYIVRRVYAGNSSAVYEISRQRVGKTIRAAVKVLELTGTSEDLPDYLDRAMDEVEHMELLRHCPYIVRYLDDAVFPRKNNTGQLIGYDVLIRMEYLTCLADEIRDGATFSTAEVRELGRQICIALAAAHAKNIVHRDIKPANLYRSNDGRFLLGDFGVCGGTEVADQLTTIAGTTAYMAPEVMLGAYDKRADLYSLGMVLYQLLNNNFLPFTDGTSTYSQRQDAIRKRRQGMVPPPPVHGDPQLQAVVIMALSFDPDQRFSSANAMRIALREHSTGAGRKTDRHRILMVLLCMLCIATGLGLGYLWGNETMVQLPNIHPTDFFDPGIDEKGTVVISTYEVIPEKLTWEKAKVYCESRGGHLATITSRKEETEIIALLEEAGLTAAWLGADNLNAANGFQWITDERFSYAAWGTNEPNNTQGEECYLMLMYQEDEGWIWNDSSNNGLDVFPVSEVGFVCEWDEIQ